MPCVSQPQDSPMHVSVAAGALVFQLLAFAQFDDDGEIQVLINGLKGRDPRVCKEAAIALGKKAAMADAAIPDLLNLIGDADTEVRLEAVRAIGYISPTEKAVPQIRRLLTDGDARVRNVAVWALGRIGPKAKEA